MKITNYKEYDEVVARRTELEKQIEDLTNQLNPLFHELNEVYDSLEDYDAEQRALDE